MSDGGIRVGEVTVDVVPDGGEFWNRFKAGAEPGATQAGDNLGKTIADRIAAKVRDALPGALAAGTRAAGAQGAAAGDSFGGSFARTVRTRIDAALRDLPQPHVGVDATELDAELADIRGRLEALRDVRVGVDIQTTDALAELDRLTARIDELGARSPDINVQVDAVKASAELAAIQAEVDALDGEDITLNVAADTGPALSGLSAMEGVIAGLGPALIPIGAAATAGLAGIATAAASGAAGLGVLYLGASQVSAAVKLLGQEHTAEAQQAANAAAGETAAASAQAAAARQVQAATQSLALARQQAASQEISATEAVAAAQYAKTQADQQEAAAQQALNQAREQAARDLESSSNRVVDTQLAARQAAIDVQNAQATYNATLASGTATTLQKQQAALDLAKAQQALVEANEAAKQAEQDNNAAQKAGVAGAPGVVAAAKAVADGHHNQQQAAQQLADAERNRALVEKQAAASITQASNALTAALAQQQKAAQGTGTAGATALQTIRGELAKTNPAVLAFAQFWTGTLVPAFTQLKNIAAAGFLPGLQAGFKAMTPLLQPFAAFVSSVAVALGFLFQQAGQALTAPFWTQFFAYIQQTAGPTLIEMGQAFGNIAKGFAGLFEAFGPIVNTIGAGFVRFTAAFAQWAAGLSSNGGFQKFLQYVRTNGPRVVDLFVNLAGVLGKLITAFAPLGAVILQVVGFIARLLNNMNTDQLLEFVAGIGLLVASLTGGAGLAVAVVALATLVVNHWTPIKNFFLHLWQDIVNEFHRNIQTVESVLGAFSTAGLAVGRFFSGPFVGFFTGMWRDIVNEFHRNVATITHAADTIVGFFQKLPGRIATASTHMWDGIASAFQGVINMIIGWWNGLSFNLDIPSNIVTRFLHLAGQGFTLSTPDLPLLHFADGGMATAATLGVFGEAGREAILPLDNPNAIAAIRDALAPRGHSGPLVGELVINNPKPERSSTALPRALRKAAYQLGYA